MAPNNPYEPSKASLSAVDIRPPVTRTLEGGTGDPPAVESTDFVRVAACASATEAHLLKGVLEASGLAPRLADANFVQADTWMSSAVGGVRVLVPVAQVEAARQAIAEYDAGAFQLEGEENAPAPTHVELASPVYSPDRATLLSFLLTPAFGAALQFANAVRLGTSREKRVGGLWFIALGAASVLAIVGMHRVNPGPFVVFRASVAVSGLTAVWYFLAGQSQTKRLIATYGRNYPQRRVAPLSIVGAAVALVIGWSITEFG